MKITLTSVAVLVLLAAAAVFGQTQSVTQPPAIAAPAVAKAGTDVGQQIQSYLGGRTGVKSKHLTVH